MTSALFCPPRPASFKPDETTKRRLNPGQILYREGDRLPKIYQVSSGWVKLTRTTLKGQNFIVELLFPGDYFDLTCHWDGGPSALTARGLNLYPAEINCLSIQDLREPVLMGSMQRQMIAQMRRQQETILALATYTVAKKVLLGLQRMARKGGHWEGSRVKFPLPLTRQELGDWIGTSSESGIRALGDLQRKGSITLINREVSCEAKLFHGLPTGSS